MTFQNNIVNNKLIVGSQKKSIDSLPDNDNGKFLRSNGSNALPSWQAISADVWTCQLVETDVAEMLPFVHYITNSVNDITLTMPVTSTECDKFRVSRRGDGNATVQLNSGQEIHYNVENTLSGGTIVASAKYSSITYETVIADTEFIVIQGSGMWEVN